MLENPVEWTGAVHAAMYVQVGARDCDLIVRVSDVYPDGRSMLIADYHRRGAQRQVSLHIAAGLYPCLLTDCRAQHRSGTA